MIETGKFYKTGTMGEIDPGHPNSKVPYYMRVDENTVVPEGANIEEGEFAIAMISAGFDPKTKKPTGSTRYYVKATDDVKKQVEKNCDEFAKSIARLLHQKVREYQAEGLDYFEEMRKQAEKTSRADD